jgi:inorganic pyrophosphatase
MKRLQVIVEAPKGSPVKYKYDPSSGIYKLHKALPMGMVFPFDFGFVPGTLGEDGDPLDVLVVSEFTTFPGCQVEVRIIGAMQVEQTARPGGRKFIINDRFIAIPTVSRYFGTVRSVKGLPAKALQEVEDFFFNYLAAEGKVFKMKRLMPAGVAIKLISRAYSKE